VLDAAGTTVTPDDLVPQIYLPGRHGSLQIELIAASRRHQRIPYVLAPEAAALFAEVAAGHPVLVLQDLGVGPLHVWHYAVVIGYSAQPQRVVLRSGTTRRLEMAFEDFAATWRKSDFWALAVLPADVLPATADARRYVDSIVPLETLGDFATARTAYTTALARWPDDPLALFGLANVDYRLGDLAAAQATYRALLERSPGNAIVLNNLAEVLLARGCPNAALDSVDEALRGKPDATIGAAIADTRAKARAARDAGHAHDAAECAR